MIHTRHSALFDISNLSITLIGTGGIGAITAVTLSKMGLRFISLYDDDVVSEENMATQLHKISSLGKPKVEVVRELIQEFSDDIEAETYIGRVDHNDEIQDYIVISAVDSIQARKDIWQAINANDKSARWYLDARMAAEELQLFVVDMENEQQTAEYEEMISTINEEDVIEAPCTSKATFYCAALSAAIIGRTVRMIAMGQTPPYRFIQNLISDFVLSVR